MTQRLGVLDGLRGIAILWVVWYHVWEISFLPAPLPALEFVPETGFLGVLLFFFLSGFVISYPFVSAAAEGRPQPAWGHFAWRRFIKIVPSYLLSIAVAYAIGYAQSQGSDPIADVGMHLLFVQTWFPDHYGSINGVLWSLSVEIEFYCLFPFIWLAFRRTPWLTTAILIGAAWAWRRYMAHCCLHTLFPTYEQNLPGFLDIFACGILTSYLYVRVRERFSTAGRSYAAAVLAIAGIVALVALLQNLFDFRAADQWDGVWQIDKRPLLGAAFATIALGSLLAPRWWQILFDNLVLRYFASISYNLYLYHQMIARVLLNRHFPAYIGDPHTDTDWQVRYTIVALLMTCSQATIVTDFVERPLLRLPAPKRWLLTKKAGCNVTP